MELTLIQGEFTGKTTDEAIAEGLKQLSLTQEQADIEVLEEGKKGGFLGIGAVRAKVRITKKKGDGERAVIFLEGLFDLLNIAATTELLAEGEKIEIGVTTTNSNSVIGRRGEILDAIQTLAGAVANTGREEYKRVVVDCEGYREKREETLIELAKKLADKAVAKGRKIFLEPMTPYERRIIHSTLSENPDVKTVSEGKEPSRHIVIVPNNLKEYPAKKPFNKNAKGGKKPFNKNFKREEGEKSESQSGEKKPYNKKPYGDRKPYNKDKKPYGGERRERSPRPAEAPRKKSSFMGTFIGKNTDNTENNKD